MIKKLRTIMVAALAVCTLSLAVAPAPALAGVDAKGEITEGINAAGGRDQTSLEDRIKLIVNILLFVLGAIAVIMIVIGGIRYAVSAGDASQAKAAKDTILYSVVGLIVALLAYAIVNFVVSQF